MCINKYTGHKYKVTWSEQEETVKFIQGHSEMRENMAAVQNSWSAWWAPAFSRFLVLLCLVLFHFSTLPVTSFGKFGQLKSHCFFYMKSKLCYVKGRNICCKHKKKIKSVFLSCYETDVATTHRDKLRVVTLSCGLTHAAFIHASCLELFSFFLLFSIIWEGFCFSWVYIFKKTSFKEK